MVEELIAAVVLAEHGNQTRAAKRLHISVRTVQRHAARMRRAERVPSSRVTSAARARGKR
jgi:DNA-binding transcriptional LysR family regulator